MRPTKLVKIGEYSYELALLGTTEGMELFPLLEGLAGGKNLDKACPIFAKATTVVNGNQRLRLSEVFDEHFAGRYFELFEWVGACVEFNYGPFLEKLRAKHAASEPGRGSSSPGAPSPGSSGGS